MSGFTLHFLRHGEPEGTGRLIGRTDALPRTAGIAACVNRARGLGAMALHSSDLARARLAGEAISRVTGLPLSIDARWRELDFGEWDGLAPGDVDGAALDRFWRDPDSDWPPGGERWSALVDRVSAAIRQLVPQPTLVVAHGGSMRAALAVLCGFGVHQTWAIDLPYGCLLSLRVWPGKRSAAQIVGLRP